MSKSHWKTVTLGEVAENSTAATKDPYGDGYTRYVIGKHIPTDSSRITTWNEVGDGEFGSRIRTMFRAGDIICTTRGPNLRVAVPDFDGLSAHTNFILRTKDSSLLLQKYLEYVVASDGFQNHLKLNFRGSTNLFVNWSDAAKYEFLLPPVDEQRRIADLLWAADDVIERNDEAIMALRKVKQAIASSFFSENTLYPRKKLGDLSLRKPQYGANAPAIAYQKELPRFIRITDIDDYGDLGTDIVSLQSEDWKDYLLEDGDFMFARTGATVGKTYIYRPEHGLCVFAGYLVRFKLNRDLISPEYLFEFTKSLNYARWIKNTVRVGAQPNINATEYASMEIPTPSLDEQQAFLRNIQEVESRIKSYLEHQKLSIDLKKQMISNLIG